MNLNEIIKQIWDQTSQNEFFQGGFLLGVLAWVGMQIKSIPITLWRRVDRVIRYTVYFDSSNPMYEAFSDWYYSKYPTSFKRVEAQLKDKHSNPVKRFWLMISQYDDINYIWYKGRMIVIRKSKQTLEAARDKENRHLEVYEMSSIFGKRQLNEIISQIEKYWNDKHTSESGLRIIFTGKYGMNSSKYIKSYKKIDNVFIDNKDELIEDIRNFLEKEDVYEKLGIKFKRTYMFYGPPGTGKSTLALAVADWLKMSVYYINPTIFEGDVDFEDFIEEVEDWSIILIEDIDIFWTNRDQKNNNMKISFQSLLNVLDGAKSPDKVIIIMTSNRIELFDDAFLRKGRLDKQFYCGHPSKDMVEGFVQNFYGENFKLESYDGEIPMVNIQDICLNSSNIEEFKNKLINN